MKPSSNSVYSKTSMASSVGGSVISRRSAASKRSAAAPAPAPRSKCCCIWTVVLIVLVLLAVAGILIWKFAPLQQAVDAVVPGASPSSGSSPSPESTYQFNQCTTTDDCCNGLDTICDLNVNEVLFAGTHNSYASQDEGFQFLYANQITKVEDQMDAGYRAINLDVCSCNNKLVLCHNSCFMTRSTTEVFTGMVSFLDNNPTEILLVTLELNPDMDQAVDLNDVYSEMQGVTGFVDYLYVHSSSSTTWPTLRKLKAAGTRMLVFHYRGPQCFSDDPCPDGLHYWFSYAYETIYDFDNVDAITSDYTTSCSPDRGADGTKAFFGINHFLSLPNSDSAKELGTASMLNQRITKCSAVNNDQPVSAILVDFASETSLLEVTQVHNQALASRRAA